MTTFNADELTAPAAPEPHRVTDNGAEVIDAELADGGAWPEGENSLLSESTAKPGAEVAVIARMDVSTLEPDWGYHWLEFRGDKLGIRIPDQAALAAFHLACGKYIDNEMRGDLSSFFIAKHMSHESFGRAFSRLMDPDDVDYNVDVVSELVNAIIMASLKQAEADKAKTGDTPK